MSIQLSDHFTYRKLAAFVLPTIAMMVLTSVYTMVDALFISHYAGEIALAAVNFVFPVIMLLGGLGFMFGTGGTALVAKTFGQGDSTQARRYFTQITLLAALIGCAMATLGILFLPEVCLLLGGTQDIIPDAVLYGRIMLGFLPCCILQWSFQALLVAAEKPKMAFWLSVAGGVTNIALDCIAVFWLGWGIAGAAAATVAAQCLSGAICAVKIARSPQLRFRKEHLKPRARDCRDLAGIGSPIAAKNMIIATGGMVIQSYVNGFALSFIAGFTATNKLYGLLEIAALSYGYAVTTYVGQNYGAHRPDRIRKGVRSAVILSLITSVVMAVLMLLLGRHITMLFISSEDPAMMAAAGETAYQYLCVMSLCLPILYLLYVFLSALQGIGRTVDTMVSGIIEFFLRVGLAMVVGHLGYAAGLYGAEVSAWFGAAVYLAISYFRGMRKLEKGKD